MNSDIPLEDNFDDVISKARRGLKLSEAALAQNAGIDLRQLEDALAGKDDAPTLAKIAQALNLDGVALAALVKKTWRPAPPATPAGFAMFNTPFHDMTVNAYLVWDQDAGKAVAFDTGADCSEMLRTMRDYGLTLEAVFITHAHSDHVAALGKLIADTNAAVYAPARETVDEATSTLADGARSSVGALDISARSTPGHSPGGTTYVVEGLANGVRLAIVGDALFAGSMGGVPPERYAGALEANRENILSLPDDTIICSGHGPLTTVGHEKRHNPFYARSPGY